MAELTRESTIEELENFLLFHMEKADQSKSVLNPVLTKEQSWNILMGVVMKQSVRVQDIALRNAVKEFGSYYETSEGDLNE